MAENKYTNRVLLPWYRSLSPQKVDIVGDLAGKELFAIYGDSLMLHCITNAKVDYTNGFQLLHAIFAVEDFLEKLRRCGCNFHVVWFADHEELCVPGDTSGAVASGYRLTRAILIQHLEKNTGGIDPAKQSVSVQFESIQCDKFQRYLAQNAIHFFLSHDGQSKEILSAPRWIHYLNFIYHLVHRGYCLAFISGIEFASSKVRASVCSPSRTTTPVQLETIPRTPRISVGSICEPPLPNDSPWEDAESVTARDIVSLISLSSILLIDRRQCTKDCVMDFIIHLSTLTLPPCILEEVRKFAAGNFSRNNCVIIWGREFLS